MSTTTASFPKIASVAALPGYRLRVNFRNGDVRVYDFAVHLERDEFRLLNMEAFFNAVRVDASGYGLIWNDEMDIAASELWLNGEPVKQQTYGSAGANLNG